MPVRRRRALRLPDRIPWIGALLLLGTLALLLGGGQVAGTAAVSEADEYATAIRQALALVEFAERGDAPSRREALSLLERIAGSGQREVLEDLRKEPPDLADAQIRLSALLEALRGRADTPDPAQAQRQLSQILAMPRYDAMRAGPSLLDRISGWLLQQIVRLLTSLGLGISIPPVLIGTLAAALLLAVTVLVLRAAIVRGGREARPPVIGSPVQPPDYFAQADGAAKAGDYLTAIRALAAGVLVALSGERAWGQSPFTVRELFQRAERPHALRPILLPFEAAAYGHRVPDPAAYAKAAEAAEPFRGRIG